ncbi:MAG: hypothetical protein HYZ24_07115 [Chloroflexi bacterium]|nr:hypothetical protein [Chloroflexota bacterium]
MKCYLRHVGIISNCSQHPIGPRYPSFIGDLLCHPKRFFNLHLFIRVDTSEHGKMKIFQAGVNLPSLIAELLKQLLSLLSTL